MKEEVIVISTAEQKVSEAAEKKRNSIETETILDFKQTVNNHKRRSISLPMMKDDKTDIQQKRVKFGDSNRARSWTASMQRLQDLEIKPILQKSPEKSILLKKGNPIINLSRNTKTNVRGNKGRKKGK